MVVAGPQRLGHALDVDRAGRRRAAISRCRPDQSRPSTDAGSWRREAASQSIAGRCIQRLSSRRCGSSRYVGVVEQAELVAHVDQRQPAVGERDRVQEQDTPDREVEGDLVGRGLQARQGRARAGGARLAGARVGLEARAAGERAGELARVEVGQEAPMQVGVLADAPGVLGRDRPADVVVAAHVGQPAGAGRDRRHRLQRAGHQRHPPRRQRAPQQDHEHVVVGEVALLALVLARPEVGDEVARARRSPRP